ncbi:hypothetical protein HBIAX_03830 [Achromobacter xylosoxidans]|nr:hypothetical protein HBIAX_03830 [Achromobacter xylosoxidans]
MAKFEEQFKLKVVQEYLKGTERLRSLAVRHELDHALIRRWVETCHGHGLAGLGRQSGSYNASFKRSVLLRISREGLSDIRAATLLGIRSSGHIAKWRTQYDAGV